MASLFANAWNPSEAEIRAWASDPISLAPVQDWDLALLHHGVLVLELASDARCPKRDFFLRVLYLIVGDAVRTDYRAVKRDTVDHLLQAGRGSSCASIERWVTRSRELMVAPSLFNYELWCNGGHARQSAPG